VRREVALKIIKLGMDTRQVIARFEAERQALAMMDHPGIARVFDAGATESGRPYFAMELVRGEPITQYCDRERLDIRARLGLFRRVCLAVQHAHQKGIIHRDIKPSNVLVAEGDDEPRPKVIDFGIAKATNSELTERTLLTERHQLVGTPEYMSPEQADQPGEDIDTRSDIYSLGVLLYELLTGATPFDGSRLRSASWADLQRIIREEEPPKPSTRVSASPAADNDRAERGQADAPQTPAPSRAGAEQIARLRRADPPSLARVLRGELDWIVMKALAKERSRRYATTSELADDVERFLRNQPVLASPPSVAYKLTKFVQRHRAPLAAGVATGLALVVAVVALGIAVVRVNHERNLAVRAGTEASAARDGAEAVTGFLAEMLAAVDPGRSGLDVTVREVLDDASTRIDDRFRDRPLVEARLRRTVGETYGALGLYAAAEQHLRRAHALFAGELGERSEGALTTEVELGLIMERQGQYDEAAQVLERALVAMDLALGERHVETLAAMRSLGQVRIRQGDYKSARPLLERVLGVERQLLGEDDRATLSSLASLALVLHHLGEFGEAESMYAAALEGWRRTQGDDSPDTLMAMGNLCSLYTSQGRWADAEPLCEQVLSARRRVLGPEHPETLRSLNSLASLRFHQGRLEEAERLGAEVIDLRRTVLGPEHPETINSLNNQVTVVQALGRIEEAEEMAREVLRARRSGLGPEHPHTLTAMSNLASILGELGRHEEAEPLHVEALDVKRRTLGPEHFSTLLSMNGLGQLYMKMGRHAEAAELLRSTSETTRRVLSDRHGFTGIALMCYGESLRELERYGDAERALLDARAVFEAVYAPGHKYLQLSANNLRMLYERWGRAEDAQRWASLAAASSADHSPE
jgi:non-specific serine/threonine protein kinase/serine/threonine-protein kinase